MRGARRDNCDLTASRQRAGLAGYRHGMDPIFRALFFTAALVLFLIQGLLASIRARCPVDLTALGLAAFTVPFMWDAWEAV